MDFFDHQEAAHRRSGWIRWLFVLAIVSACAAMCLFVFVVYAAMSLVATWGTGDAVPNPGHYRFLPIPLWQPQLFAWTSGATALFILIASWWRMRQLSAGGPAVAKLLQAPRMNPASPRREERLLVDVVEEMGLAAGIAAPAIHILRGEHGLNAFIAGHGPADAALFVTEGTLKCLNRDELQALVAHEFSHLLRGDMRLNLNLLGLVHGLFALYLFGEQLMSPEWHARRHLEGDVRTGGLHPTMRKATHPLLDMLVSTFGSLFLFVPWVAGFVIGVVGWNTAFFGRVIKGWVAREREFLADADALQFTRHPEALVAVLAAANAWPQHGVLRTREAESFSHMCFLRVLPDEASWMVATHPPVPERILRVEQMGARIVGIRTPRREPPTAADEPIPMPAAPRNPAPATVSAASLLAQTGLPVSQHLAWSASWLQSLNSELREAAHAPASAEALVCLLLLRGTDAQRPDLQAEISAHAPPAVVQALRTLAPRVSALSDFDTLPLLDLCVPALRSATAEDYARLSAASQRITQADRQVDLFEFALQNVLRRHLDPVFRSGLERATKFEAAELPRAAGTMLSLLAHAGAAAADHARDAFADGARKLPALRAQMELLPVTDCSLASLESALAQLAAAPPTTKREVLSACAATAAADGQLSPREAELLRAIAAALDCPVPPLAG